MASPKVLSAQAKVTAVGRPTATSCGKVGPDRTAMGAPGWTLSDTSDINLCGPASIPLEQSMSGRLPTCALPGIEPRCRAGVNTKSGRATCRERVIQEVSMSVEAGAIKQKTQYIET